MGCSAPNCFNSHRKKFRMFRFPSDPERRRKWAINCGREGWIPGPRALLCNVHFEESQYEQHRADGWKKLKPNAVPTLFDGPSTSFVTRTSEWVKTNGLPQTDSVIKSATVNGVQKRRKRKQKRTRSWRSKRIQIQKHLKNERDIVHMDTQKHNQANMNGMKKVSPENINSTHQNINFSSRIVSSKKSNSKVVSTAISFLNGTVEIANSPGYSVATCVISKPIIRFKIADKISQLESNSNTTKAKNSKRNQKHEITIYGRRIVEMNYFFRMLKIANQHNKFGCNLNDLIIMNERKAGLSSSYRLKCTVCGYEMNLNSECPLKERITTDTIVGMLDVGINFESMNKLLSKMDLPTISSTIFVKIYYDKIVSHKTEKKHKLINQTINHSVTSFKNFEESGKKLSISNNQEPFSSFHNSNKMLGQQYNECFISSAHVTSVFSKNINILPIDSVAKICRNVQTISYGDLDSSNKNNTSGKVYMVASDSNGSLTNSSTCSVLTNTTSESLTFLEAANENSQFVSNSSVNSTVNLKTISNRVIISGRRIIEFNYFFKMLQSVNQHSKNGCNLKHIIIKNERTVGLQSVYLLKCTVCDYETSLNSECPTRKKNINTDIIAGIYSINVDFSDMNKLLLKMYLPSINYDIFLREYDKLNIPSCEKASQNLNHINMRQENSQETKKEFGKKQIVKQEIQDDFDRILIEDEIEIEIGDT